ncbi:MAG TPA: cytochrome c nitrite reductase small subunit [Bryobacteraceae bacterium]
MERIWRYLLVALAGSLLGLGAYTFVYAQGFSYFSNNPDACANCHVMREYRDAWARGSHHAHAACNDCHTPHALAPKYFVKARNGWNHSLRFTLQNFPDPIRIRPANSEVLEANCIRCHREMVSEVDGFGCVRCHPGVGHGASPR